MKSPKSNMAASIRSVRRVLLEDWDPIGIRDVPQASDEYDSYVMPIYGILRQRRSEKALTDYLRWITEHMGMPTSRDSLRPIAAKLLHIDISDDEDHE